MVEEPVWAQYAERLGRVVAHIHDHLDDDLDMAQLATIACLSPWHWHRIYRAVHQETAVATVKRLLNSGAAMDIWVLDSNGDDDRIRSWAAQVGIPPAKVRAGTVTLNHGGSLNVDSSELPRVAPRG